MLSYLQPAKDALLFCLCYHLFGLPSWLWATVVGVRELLRVGAAPDLEAQSQKQVPGLNPFRQITEYIQSTSWFKYVFTPDYWKHTAINIVIGLAFYLLPLIVALGLRMGAKVETVIDEFQQKKPVESVVIKGLAWVICLDQVSGGHVFELVRTGIYNSFGVDRKKKEDTLPMFMQETLGGPAAALAKAKTFGLF